MKKRIAVLMFCVMLICGISQAASVIDPSDSNIQYRGRWDYSNPSAPWCHAKSSTIIANFQGTSIAVNFSGGTSDYIRIIIDNDVLGSVKIPTPVGRATLASGLSSDTNHKIEIVKETDQARMTFRGFELDDGKSLNLPPDRPARKTEFYGDSNQAGYSLESERNDGDVALRGNYYTYPAIVARMFDAEYVNFSKSGSTIGSTDTAHNRIDWSSSSPLWDFDKFQADLVVVNVGANDKNPERRKKDKYHAFLDDLRAEHPSAHIMLYNAYGWSFNEPANYIQEVIEARNDSNMSWAVFPWVFAQWHGCEYDHGGMAMVLADHISRVLGWDPAPQDVFSGFGSYGNVANGSFEEVAPFGGWGWRYFDDPGVSRVHDPDGAYDRDYYLRLSDGAHSQQTNPANSGDSFTVTAHMRGANDGDQVHITIDFRDQGDGGRETTPVVAFTETKTLTTNWAQYSMSATAPISGNPIFGTRITFTASTGDTVDIDGVVAFLEGGSICGDTNCDPGEDQCNCPDDCGTPPSTETSCTDEVDNDCDNYTDCDDSDCDGNPSCSDCLPKRAACTDNAECCSGTCLPAGKCK